MSGETRTAPAGSGKRDLEPLRVVVVGQVPPPALGQYVATAELVEALRRSPRLDVRHLPLYFARSATDLRVPRLGKVLELFLALARLVRIRLAGPIDCALYPIGGPFPVVVLRDALLLGAVEALSRNTLLIFHGGGHAEVWSRQTWWQRVGSAVYRRATGAIVFTDYGRVDPEAIGIASVSVVPHTLPDEFHTELVGRRDDGARILYLGSLSVEKGVSALLEAFAHVVHHHPAGGRLELELVGEPRPSYPWEAIHADLSRLDIEDRVHLSGVLRGEAKARALGRANLFVFPSVYPAETFGLVLLEAMMWSLPIVATRWRATPDVVGRIPDPLLVEPGPDLVTALTAGLTYAVDHRADWAEWGRRNRHRYEESYRTDDPSGTEEVIVAVCRERRSSG